MEFQIGDIVVWRYHQSDDVIPHGIIVNIEELTGSIVLLGEAHL